MAAMRSIAVRTAHAAPKRCRKALPGAMRCALCAVRCARASACFERAVGAGQSCTSRGRAVALAELNRAAWYRRCTSGAVLGHDGAPDASSFSPTRLRSRATTDMSGLLARMRALRLLRDRPAQAHSPRQLLPSVCSMLRILHHPA